MWFSFIDFLNSMNPVDINQGAPTVNPDPEVPTVISRASSNDSNMTVTPDSIRFMRNSTITPPSTRGNTPSPSFDQFT